jgi:ubiquinone/menaquinone biosynthesis C-methylase UbiE
MLKEYTMKMLDICFISLKMIKPDFYLFDKFSSKLNLNQSLIFLLKNNMLSKTHSKKVKKFYDALSKYYDERWWHNNPDSRHTKLFTSEFSYSVALPGSMVLDVGCGTCDTAIKLVSKKCKIIGLDLSSKMLSIASKKIPEEYKNRIFLIQSNAEDLPFHNDQFDYIISEFALDYISNPSKAIKEMTRVLKKGGRLLLIVSNKKPLYIIFWEFLIGNWEFIKKLRQKEGTIDFPHLKIKSPFRRYSTREINDMISDLPIKTIGMIGTHSLSGFIGYPILLLGLFIHKIKEKKTDFGRIDHYIKIRGGDAVFEIFKIGENVDQYFNDIGRDIIFVGEKI